MNYTISSSLLVSSEEEEDELVFSDELAERGGSDSDSIENMDPVSPLKESLTCTCTCTCTHVYVIYFVF